MLISFAWLVVLLFFFFIAWQTRERSGLWTALALGSLLLFGLSAWETAVRLWAAVAAGDWWGGRLPLDVEAIVAALSAGRLPAGAALGQTLLIVAAVALLFAPHAAPSPPNVEARPAP